MKSTDFLKEHNAFIAQDADEMHRDQEVQMARADLYNAADYAIKLHKILRGVNDTTDMEQWVMEKIAIANENLRTVYEYLNYENKEQESAMPSFAFESADQQFEALVSEGYSMADVQRDAQANARKTIDAVTAPKEKTPFMAQVGKKIVGGVAGAVKGAYKGFTGQTNEGVAETVPMSDAVKVLKQYGADRFQTTTNELHFYKNGKGFSVDLVMNPDTTRSVTLSSLNSAARGLKGQGVAESCSVGGMSASAVATGPVGAAAPMQRRTVKKESSRYANAMKTKKPSLGKGVY